jgi:hypothetical protein
MAAGLAGASEILQFRWTDTTYIALVEQVIVSVGGSDTAFTAGFAKVDLVIARGWSADGSGGTAMTLTGNNNKLRTSYSTTLAGAVRGSSTAALTAGTKTLDAQPAGLLAFSIGVTASVNYLINEQLHDTYGGLFATPIVLAATEGFVVRATVPATGTWQFGATVKWTELSTFAN